MSFKRHCLRRITFNKKLLGMRINCPRNIYKYKNIKITMNVKLKGIIQNSLFFIFSLVGIWMLDGALTFAIGGPSNRESFLVWIFRPLSFALVSYIQILRKKAKLAFCIPVTYVIMQLLIPCSLLTNKILICFTSSLFSVYFFSNAFLSLLLSYTLLYLLYINYIKKYIKMLIF